MTGGKDGAKLDSTEILDLETLEWTQGPDLPESISYTASVPLKYTFLVVGGRKADNSKSNSIFEFDFEGMRWITRSETLVNARDSLTAFLVPDNAVNCS